MSEKKSKKKQNKKVSEGGRSKKTESYKKSFLLAVLKSKRFRNSFLIILLVALLFGAAYYFKDLFIAATVNGRPVTRVEVIRELERQNGEQALNSIITRRLIEQKAEEENVQITQEEINAEVEELSQNISEQGQTLEQFLQMQGLTQQQLIKEIRLRLTLEKLLANDINVTEEEITGYIDENQSLLPEEQDTSSEEFRGQIRDQLENQKLNQQIQTYLQNLQTEADINYFVNY